MAAPILFAASRNGCAHLLRCSEWGKCCNPILADKVSLGCAWPSQVLLEGGANPNAQNSDGRTPLHLCMPAGFSACVVHLYNAGAGTASWFYLSSIPHHLPRTRAHALPIVLCVRARHNSFVSSSVVSPVKVTPSLYLCPGLLPQMTQSRTGTERQRWTRRPRISRPRTFEEGSQGEREIEGRCGERPFSLSQSLKGITNFFRSSLRIAFAWLFPHLSSNW